MKKLFFCIVLCLTFLATNVLAEPFVSKMNKDQVYQTDTPMSKIPVDKLIPAVTRIDPRSTPDRLVTIHLFYDPSRDFVRKGTEDVIFPYCEIWILTKDGSILLLVSFITEELTFEIWENSAAHGGPNPFHLFKRETPPDRVEVKKKTEI